MLKETMLKRKEELLKKLKEKYDIYDDSSDREEFYTAALWRLGMENIFLKYGEKLITDHFESVKNMDLNELNVVMHQIHTIQPTVRETATRWLEVKMDYVLEKIRFNNEKVNFVGKEILFLDRERHLFDGGADKDIVSFINKYDSDDIFIFNGITYSNLHIGNVDYIETGLIEEEVPLLKIYGKKEKINKVIKNLKKEFKDESTEEKDLSI